MDHRWCGHEAREGKWTKDDAEQRQQNGLLDGPK
jgi:hypothetical protein